MDKASEVFKKVGDAGESTSGRLAKIAGAVGGIVAVGEAANFLKGALSAAADEQKNMAVLNNTLSTNLHLTDAQKDSNEKWITSLQNATGVSRDDLEPALGKLVIAGEDLTTAHKNMAIATDIAAARHVDLATVVQGIAKAAATGQTTALGRLGLATKDASGKTLTLQQVLANAAKTMGGSAAAAANTAAGRAEILGLKFKDLKVQIGSFLLPVMDKLTSVLSGVVGWLSDKLPGAIAKVQAYLAPFIGEAQQIFNVLFHGDFTGGPFEEDSPFIAGVFKARDILVKISDFVEAHLKPILIGLGITVALMAAPFLTVAAGLVFAYVHFQTFRDVVNDVAIFLVQKVFPVVQQFAGYLVEQFSHVVAWVQQYWPQIQEAVGHVMVAVQDVITVVATAISIFWDEWGASIVSVLEAAWTLVQTTVKNAVKVVQDVIAFALALINGDWGKAWDALKDLVGTVLGQLVADLKFGLALVEGVFTGVMNEVIDAWDGAWETVKSIVGDAVQWVLDKIGTITGPLQKVSGFIGGALNTVAPGAGLIVGKASGGPVAAGHTYRVNELGQEFFTPSTAGNITPNGDIMGVLGAILDAVNSQKDTMVRLART